MKDPALRTLQTIDRALAVIELLSGASHGMKLTAMAEKLGLKKQTLLGIVRSLQAHEVVIHEDHGGPYYLGPRIGAWYQCWIDHNGLSVSARRTVEDLARGIGEAVILAELRGHHLQVLVRSDVAKETMLAMPVESYPSLHALSTSKLLMAFLPEKER
ncbi:MAG: helix-turn-helix domain-containing protein, partial [Planctomycetes bacterium]|nr:helix-turn-helix domain-containing protein [Planctomycetota bacterium]